MQTTSKLLNSADHSRDSAGLTYVYPVISRRSGGVSIGINLNPNNACNWRCVYCQVPDLKRGSAPRIDLEILEAELRSFLNELIHGNFMERYVPLEARNIRDIALSGNGEPTSAKEFDQVIELIGHIKKDFVLPADLKTVLITNGSLIHRANVQAGLQKIAALNGEIWFKFDRASPGERRRINNTTISLKKIQENLNIAASICPTWLQTCVFQFDGRPPADDEVSSYLAFIRQLLECQIPFRGVLLYGLARPSLQPEASRLAAVEPAWFKDFEAKIRALGVTVKSNP